MSYVPSSAATSTTPAPPVTIPDPKPLLSSRPAKAIYLAYTALATLFVRLPCWVLYYLPPSNRPKEKWSLKRAIIRKAFMLVFDITHHVGELGNDPDHHALHTAPVPKVRYKGVWIPAAPAGTVIGRIKEWADQANVECGIKVPGYWVANHWWPKDKEEDSPPLKAESGGTICEKVLICFHSGAFAKLSAHPSSMGATAPLGIINGASPATGVRRALFVEYRKSRPPRDGKPGISFPAALIDAVAAYSYLVHDVGVPPQDIVLFGDSSGGNEVLALARYLVEYKDQLSPSLPVPGHAIIHSSYTDMGHSDYSHPESSIFVNRATDYYTPEDISVHIAWFLGPFGRDGPAGARNNVYISPASETHTVAESATFRGFPRTLNIVGGAEILRDQNRLLNERMKRDMGEGGAGVTYVEFPAAAHNFLMMEWHEPERSEALKLIDDWLQAA